MLEVNGQVFWARSGIENGFEHQGGSTTHQSCTTRIAGSMRKPPIRRFWACQLILLVVELDLLYLFFVPFLLTIDFLRYFGTITTWYRQYHFT